MFSIPGVSYRSKEILLCNISIHCLVTFEAIHHTFFFGLSFTHEPVFAYWFNVILQAFQNLFLKE